MRMFQLFHPQGIALWKATDDPEEKIVNPVWAQYHQYYPSGPEPTMASYFDGEELTFDHKPAPPADLGGAKPEPVVQPLEQGVTHNIIAYDCRDCGVIWNPALAYNPPSREEQGPMKVTSLTVNDDGEPQGTSCPNCGSYNARVAQSERIPFDQSLGKPKSRSSRILARPRKLVQLVRSGVRALTDDDDGGSP